MQLSNLTLRLGGSMLHTVPKINCTPAEILVLRALHGDDAVVDVRPTKFDKTRRHEDEYERLSTLYDRAASTLAPGGDSKSVMGQLFPGAMKKLPVHLKEIGLGHLMSPTSIAAVTKAEDEQAAGDKAAAEAVAAREVDIIPEEEDAPEEPEDIFTEAA